MACVQTLVTDSIKDAARLLRQGELVIFPTETVYGLGANALDALAVVRIYQAKQRPADNPLIVHIHCLDQVEELVQDVPDYAWDLMHTFFPGPLTLLLPKRPIVPDATTAGSSKVCLRMPSSPLACRFIKECAVPIAAPSANLSGRPSPTRWQDCLEDMAGRVAAILKGPEAAFGLESTIVDCTGSTPMLMRPGAISLEELTTVVPTTHLAPTQTNLVLPGMKYRHYAPQAHVHLLAPGESPLAPEQSAAYIGLTPPAFVSGYTLLVHSPQEYAHSLFAFFRECDRRAIRAIYAERVSEVGMGRAIMNRLNKAAAGG
ncbi:MAG: threonylcarbamoyl-AMP synthase [Chloroflexi bacterium]|nr:threonylcarbamoyl-AMP synthase [Chloroflexota bacterium]